MPGAVRSATPKEERQEAARARILEAARTLFQTGGVAALSVRAIAARAGMPVMTLYGYFPGKTAIVRALWSEAFEPLFAELDAAEAAEADPKLRLRRVAQALVDYWLRFPDRYRMVFLIEDRREGDGDRWFIEETDVVSGYVRFGPLIAAARGTPEADCAREGEALLCGLTGIVHMLVTVSEYPWSGGDTYVDALLRAF
ncbi:MAG: TetR/AcrR family transcriptional regulator [Phenylobacterium sp.]|uniref:TetR/AcrR family transcriptional regulator n=1 Tax=Phenylobacterium sp. TaxID=1871053 RepID=UPI001A5C6166|nr:TetR/AcrR family transcriptional regulator [Phenylobacterium sp.]MBL8555893.1 TetR/AcrR family transcriptional regulator [Phenylobacterium sp.]